MSSPLVRRVVVVALLPWTAGGCGPGDTAGLSDDHAAAMRDSVRATLEAYEEAVHEGAWDRVSELYADEEDFHWVEDGRVAYPSVEGIREALASFDSLFTEVETDFGEARVVPLAPGVAHVTSEVAQRFVSAGGGEFGFTATFTSTLVHRDGAWRFLVGHTSMRSETTGEGEGR